MIHNNQSDHANVNSNFKKENSLRRGEKTSDRAKSQLFLTLNLIGEARDVSSPETNHSLKESKTQEILDYSLLKITLTSNMPVFQTSLPLQR